MSLPTASGTMQMIVSASLRDDAIPCKPTRILADRVIQLQKLGGPLHRYGKFEREHAPDSVLGFCANVAPVAEHDLSCEAEPQTLPFRMMHDIGFDESVGKQEGDEKHTGQHSYELIHGLVAKGGQSLPVIDVPTIARLANGTALTSREAAAVI